MTDATGRTVASDAAARGTANTRGPVQERGRRRRDALVEAAAELLVAGGSGAVTHRSVAERAGFPLASTTYYFASRDDLLDQALARLVDRDLEQMRSAVAGAIMPGRPVEEHARAIVDALIAPGDGTDPGCWDLYIQIGHEPSLRPRARAWTDGIRAVITDLLSAGGYCHGPADVRLMIAVVDGLSVENVVEDRRAEHAETVEIVTRVLAALSR